MLSSGGDAPSGLTILATKPRGKPAAMLAELGIGILPIEEDEGNVDRYLLSKRVAIERRTGSRFLRGLADKTLFASAIYLREHFVVPILIVEGAIDNEYTSFDPQAVRAALSSMMLCYGLSVLSSSSVEETVGLIAMMARQEHVGIPEISLIPKRKAVDLADRQRRVIEMLPGCGRVMARDLLQRLGSVKQVVNASAEELQRVRGVGAKKAREIARVLSAEYESVDTERDLEEAIEVAPELVFKQPVTLLARQHGIGSKEARHVVDLVFLDAEADEVIVVEAKRGRLTREHEQQLRKYLESAHESRLVGGLLERGTAVRGVLVTIEESDFTPKAADVSAHIVDRQKVIEVLRGLRERRRSSGGSGTGTERT